METWLQNSIGDDKLRESITQLINDHPNSKNVIQQLIHYYQNKLDNESEEVDKKKRKLTMNNNNGDGGNEEKKVIISSISDISFQLPARKKYTLAITSCQTVQLVNEKTKQIEYEYLIDGFQSCICVPTPDKPQGSFTFSIFSNQMNNNNENENNNNHYPSSLSSDTIVFSILDKGTITIKQQQQSSSNNNDNDNDKIYTTSQEKKQAMIHFILQHILKEDNKKMVLPSKEFYTCSGVSPSTGKPELERTYVNTYLRNKEGVLYFLPTGILYGFKKPTLFIPLSMISATIITNITKRTFDINFQLFSTKLPLGNNSDTTFWTPFLQQDDSHHENENENDNEKKNEKKTVLSLPFSMVEQTEFGGIDAYIKKMGINDQSMTEATKAPEPINNKKGKGVDRGEQQQDQEGNPIHGDNNDEDSEEDDIDFVPQNNSDDDDLEYDSNASGNDDDDASMHSFGDEEEEEDDDGDENGDDNEDELEDD